MDLGRAWKEFACEVQQEAYDDKTDVEKEEVEDWAQILDSKWTIVSHLLKVKAHWLLVRKEKELLVNVVNWYVFKYWEF